MLKGISILCKFKYYVALLGVLETTIDVNYTWVRSVLSQPGQDLKLSPVSFEAFLIFDVEFFDCNLSSKISALIHLSICTDAKLFGLIDFEQARLNC